MSYGDMAVPDTPVPAAKTGLTTISSIYNKIVVCVLIVNAVAELSDTATFISVPSGLIESTAMSPIFVDIVTKTYVISKGFVC